MKRLYKRLIMLLLAAVMLVSLAACAGQDTPQPNGSESAQPSHGIRWSRTITTSWKRR